MYQISSRKIARQEFSQRQVSRRVKNALIYAAEVEKLRNDDAFLRMPCNWRLAGAVTAKLFRGLIVPVVVLVLTVTAGGGRPKGGIVSIIALIVLLLSTTAYGSWLRNAGPRVYKETCFAAYYGGLAKTTGIKSLEAPPSRVAVVPQWQRLKDARRWGRFLALVGLLRLAAVAMLACTGAMWLLWSAGLAQAPHVTSSSGALDAAWQDIVWNLANSIPVLDLPGALHWAQPGLYAHSLLVNVFLLMVRVAIFGPVIVWVLALLRQSVYDPRNPLTADAVVNAFIAGIVSLDQPGEANRYPSQHWDLITSHACRVLGNGWTPDRIWDHMSNTTVSAII